MKSHFKNFSLFFLSSFVLLASSQALASDKIEYIPSSGYASGYCDGHNSYMCLDGLKRNAASDAERDATWKCQSKNGRLEFGTMSACSFSNPYLPPNGPGTYVSVTANCQFRCFIPQALE